MPQWMIPADKLDKDQKQFIFQHMKESANYWIKGFPGSGKSVLMMHALADIIKREPRARILITFYTYALNNLYQAALHELGINSNNITFVTYFQFKKTAVHYDYILCDEVQDLPADVLALMKSRCKRLLIAGDPHQSIYDNTIEPHQIPAVTSCSEYTLTTIHRLTKSIIELVGRFLPDMGLFRSKRNTLKEDVTVRLGEFNDRDNEVRYIIDQALSVLDCGESAAILLPTHKDIIKLVEIYCNNQGHPCWETIYNHYRKPDYDDMNEHMGDLRVHYVGNGYGSLIKAVNSKSVVLMTYHSAKGLDFDHVYLPFLDQNADVRSKTVFMVALTRSKGSLTLTYSDDVHPFVQSIEDQCHRINTTSSDQSDDNEWGFDF